MQMSSMFSSVLLRRMFSRSHDELYLRQNITYVYIIAGMLTYILVLVSTEYTDVTDRRTDGRPLHDRIDRAYTYIVRRKPYEGLVTPRECR